MRIRLKKKGILSDRKIDSSIIIDDIIIKENLANPSGERIFIFLKGKDSSGIITLNREEADNLVVSLKGNRSLMSKIKKIKG